MKKKKPLWLKILLIVMIAGLAACVWEFLSSQNPYILPVRRALQYDVLRLSPVNDAKETANLGAEARRTLYVDGEASADGKYVRGADNKRVYETDSETRLVNYLDGYQMDFPAGATFDFSLSPIFTRASGEGWDATVSREQATYESLRDVLSFELSTFFPFLSDDSVKRYVDHYEWRFLTDPSWQENNRVTVESNELWDNRVQFITATLQDPGDAEYDAYLYATVYTKSREYIRVVVRAHSGDDTLERFRDSLYWNFDFRAFDPTGVGHYDTDYYPDYDASALSGETLALYESLSDPDAALRWGVFTKDVFTTGIDETIPALEDALDYSFDVVLGYIHFNMDFPTEFMEKNYARGRLVELTWQTTENNNEKLFAHTPFLDIYRGERDDEIRAVARAAKDFGRPFLLRLNNEMNSDWTSYSGVVNMADPQLYVAVWQRIYRVFAEEGVGNCLWIYNPNDRSAPPSKWNDSLAYYPGNEYVHLLGVTGYNNGTYYTQWNEQWRDFKEIYDEIDALYAPHFSRFPWIITEFASSSYGGDKAAWIDELFEHIGDYPNIRVAVWFSYADFDGDTPARPYWLDETPETLDAFRRGLHNS